MLLCVVSCPRAGDLGASGASIGTMLLVVFGSGSECDISRLMDAGSLRRLTIDGDSAAFPSKQCYVDAVGQLWWDLDYLYNALLGGGLKALKKEWSRDLRNIMTEAFPFDLASHCRFRSLATPLDHISNVCTSVALITYLCILMDKSRTQAVSNTCWNFLLNISLRVCGLLSEPAALNLPNGSAVYVDSAGSVHCLPGCVERLHRAKQACLKESWSHLQTLGLVSGLYDRDTHCFLDLFRFVLCLGRVRRQLKRPPVLHNDFCKPLLDAIVRWLGSQLNQYILGPYSQSNDTGKPAPAVSMGSAATRPYKRICPETVWSWIGLARDTGTSLRTAIAIKKNDADAGCSPSNGDHWAAKHQAMYIDRRELGFRFVNHFNIVADPSTHSSREAMVCKY